MLVARRVGVGAGGDGAHGAADGHRAARAVVARSDAVGGVKALGGGDGGHTASDGDGAARAFVAAADASPIVATSGRDGAASDADVVARASVAAADACRIVATSGRDGAASDADGAARASVAAADASPIVVATSGGDGAASDADVAARVFVAAAAADACRIVAALGVDGAASDADVAARVFVAAADAGCICAALGVDGAALNHDVAAGDLIAAADARAEAVAAGRERAGALDGQRLVLRNEDAGIVLIESLHRVRAAEDDGGIAQAGDARPFAAADAHAVDGHAVERHRGAVGNRDFHVIAQRASHGVAVLNGSGRRHSREVERRPSGSRGLHLLQRHALHPRLVLGRGDNQHRLAGLDGIGAVGVGIHVGQRVAGLHLPSLRHAGEGAHLRAGGRLVAVHLNLFYALTPHIATINGCAIYFRCLIRFCGFYYKWSFAVCSSTIGVVIEYTFGDGISFGMGDGCYPTVSPPSPVSVVF